MRSQLRFISLLFMMILAGAEIDLFVPSFPELQQIFNLTPFSVQLTLSVNFTAFCLSSLFVGALGDRYNRRYVMLASLLLFVMGSLFCVWANTFPILLLGRLLQGIGVAGPAILSYVIVADEYPLEEQPALLGLLNGMTAFAMAFAPVVGSFVNLYFGWRANFALLLALSGICLVVGFFTVPHKAGNKSVSLSLRTYVPLLQSKKLMSYVVSVCLLVVSYWVFVGMAPIFYMGDKALTLKEFGYYQGSLALVFSLISILSPKILKRFGQKRCFYFGKWLCFFSAICMLVVLLSGFDAPLLITGVMILFSIGVVFPLNIMYPFSLEVLENTKSRTAALIQALRLIMTAFLLELVGFFYSGKFLPIGLTMVCSLCLCFVVMRKMLKKGWISLPAFE